MPALPLYVPRTALKAGGASTSPFQLVGAAACRASSVAGGSARFLSHHQHRQFLALQLSPPPQLHIQLASPQQISGRSSWGWLQQRGIAATAGAWEKAVKKTNYPSRPKIREEEIEEKYLKGSGPGGQKINKTSSAVQLRHLPTGIVVKSQATRSREQNRKIARRILGEKLEELEKGTESRVAVLRREESRRKRSKEKKARRKYAKLAAEKNGGMVAAGPGAAGGVTTGEGMGGGDFSGPDWKEKWVDANEDYEEDDDDFELEEVDSESESDYDEPLDSDSDTDSEFSDSELDSYFDSESDSDIEFDAGSGSGGNGNQTKQSPQPPKGVEEDHEMTIEEEKEFARLAREVARQLAAEEAQREEAGTKWNSGVGEKKKEETEGPEPSEKQGGGGN